MNRTFVLALRNLLRNRRRSLTTMMAMVVGVCAILLFGGYSRDISYGLETDFVQRSGHLQIQRQGYFLYGSGNSAAFGISNYESLLTVLKADPVLQPLLIVATPSLQLGGIAGNFAAGVSRTVLAQGLIAADQNRLRQWNDYQFPGVARAVALVNTPEDSIVIGQGVARVLQLCGPLQVPDCNPPQAPPQAPQDSAPADVNALSDLETPAASGNTFDSGGPRIEVLAANTRGAPNVGSFTVIKAEQQGVKELDDVSVTMHLPRAQRLVYGGEAPQVTALIVQLHHTYDLPEARARISALLAEQPSTQALAVLDFAELNPFFEQTERMFAAIFGFVFVLIGAIVLFVVSNTMTMAIVERTVEIGTLRAIGLRRSGIQALFVTEGALLGLSGAVLGIVVALFIAAIINRSGLTWTPPSRIDAVPLTVRVWGEWLLISVTFVSLTLVAGLSAWWPARRAARLHIVDALRHV